MSEWPAGMVRVAARARSSILTSIFREQFLSRNYHTEIQRPFTCDIPLCLPWFSLCGAALGALLKLRFCNSGLEVIFSSSLQHLSSQVSGNAIASDVLSFARLCCGLSLTKVLT